MIVNQQNQNRPRKHAGWPCGHDDKCISEILAISRPRTENQNVDKLTNWNPEIEQPSNKDTKIPPAETRFRCSKNWQAVKLNYRADDGRKIKLLAADKLKHWNWTTK